MVRVLKAGSNGNGKEERDPRHCVESVHRIGDCRSIEQKNMVGK